MPPGTPRPHLILLGGFLGAGKTTAMRALAGWLADQGIRAACITNDQGEDLVDTTFLRSCGVPTDEITGGCFCCRFDDLLGATRRLRGVLPPEVYIAEPVGSCTDLVATVTAPLRRLHGEEFSIAPLSVLIDPQRVLDAAGSGPGERLSEPVRYILRKQVEEADVVVISKAETVDPDRLDRLRALLGEWAPSAEILVASSRTGTGLDGWFRRIVFTEQQARAAIDVDYDTYAEGESRLGWLNASADVAASGPGDANALLDQLAFSLRDAAVQRGAVIVHLKMTVRPSAPPQAGIAAINLVANEVAPELGSRLEGPIERGELVVNLRAEAAPDLLEAAVRDAAAGAAGWRVALTHLEAFRPGRPQPTHRDAARLTPPST